MYNTFKRLGLKSFPTPLAILSQNTDSRKSCDNRTACIESLCPTGAQGDGMMLINKINNKQNFITEIICRFKCYKVKKK